MYQTRGHADIVFLDYRNYLVAKFTGHEDAVWDLKLHPLKPLLASAGADQTVKFWNLNELHRGDDRELDISKCLTHSVKLEGSGAFVPCSAFVIRTHARL